MFIGFMLLQLAAHFLGSGGSHFCDWIECGRRLNSKQLMPYSRGRFYVWRLAMILIPGKTKMNILARGVRQQKT
jgi:hypothetical protein